FRVPVQGVKVSSGLIGLGDNDTSMGDLTVITKALLFGDGGCGLTLSGGLAATFATGPDAWGNISRSEGDLIHGTVLQPYLAYIYRFNERLFVQGFSSVDTPLRSGDVDLLLNDVAVGYCMGG